MEENGVNQDSQVQVEKVSLKSIQQQKSDELVDRVMQKILKIKD